MNQKFAATIRVLLSSNHDHPLPTGDDLCGYYRSVLLYADDHDEARSLLEMHVNDGEIDWSNSELVKVEKGVFDWIRMVKGRRIIRQSGRAFFPFEDTKRGQADDASIGWRMKN